MKDFIPYEEALELKHLGFDEEVIGTYQRNSKEVKLNNVKKTETLKAVLYSQAFRFFREKYGYYPLIEFSERSKKWLSRYCNTNGSIRAISVHNSYDDAELECLSKLIAIVKEKQ